MMAANFGQKIVISMKSTNMPVSILPKTKKKAKIYHFRKTAFIYRRFVSFNSK